MPARLYFDLVNSHDSIPDRQGIEIADVLTAKATVLAMVDELRQEDSSMAQEWSGWTLNVSDAAGHVLFKIDLDSRVHS
jgi:hypothetical protein